MEMSLEDKKKLVENHINYLKQMAEKRSQIQQGTKPALFDEKFLNTDADSYSAEQNLRVANTSISNERLNFLRRMYTEGVSALNKGNYKAAVEALSKLSEDEFKEFVNEDTFYDLNKNRFEAEEKEARETFTNAEGFSRTTTAEKGELFNVSRNDRGSVWSGVGTDEGIFNVIKAVGNYLYDKTTIDDDDGVVEKGLKTTLRNVIAPTVNLAGGAIESAFNETAKILENPAQTVVQAANLALGNVIGIPAVANKIATEYYGGTIPGVDKLKQLYEEGYDKTFGIAEDLDIAWSLFKRNDLNAERIQLAKEARKDIDKLGFTPEDNAIITKYEWEVANGVAVHSKEVSDWLSNPKNVERLKVLEDFKDKSARIRKINETLDPTHLKHIPEELYIDAVREARVKDDWTRGGLWNQTLASYHAVGLQIDFYKSLFTVDPLNDLPDVLGQASYSIGLLAPYLVPGLGEARMAQGLARYAARNSYLEFAARHIDKVGTLLKNHQNAYYIAKNILAQTHQNYWENLAEGNPNGMVWTDNALGALAGGWAAAVDIAGDELALYGARVFGGSLRSAFRNTGASVFRQAIRDSIASGIDYTESLLNALRRSSIGAVLGESQLWKVVQNLAVHGVVDGTGEAIAGAVEQVLNDLAAHGVITDQVTVNTLMSAIAATGMKASFLIHRATMPGVNRRFNGTLQLGNEYLDAYRRLTGNGSYENFEDFNTNPSERGTDAQRTETARLQTLIDDAYNTNETANGRTRAIINAIAEDLGNRGIAVPDNLAENVRAYVRGRAHANRNASRVHSLNALLHRQVFGHHYSDNHTEVTGRQAPLSDEARERLNEEFRNAAYGADFLNGEGVSRAASDMDIVNSYANQRLELGQIAENIQTELNAAPTSEREAIQRRLDDVLEEMAELDSRYGNEAHNNAIRHFMLMHAGHLNEVELTGNTNYSSRFSDTPATEESWRDTRDFEEAHDLRDATRFSEDYLNALADDLRSTDDAVKARAQRIRGRLRQEINNKITAAIAERQSVLDDPSQLDNEGGFISNNVRRLLGYQSRLTGGLTRTGRDILRQEIDQLQRSLDRFNTILDTLDNIDLEGTSDPNNPDAGGPTIDDSGLDTNDIDDGAPPSPPGPNPNPNPNPNPAPAPAPGSNPIPAEEVNNGGDPDDAENSDEGAAADSGEEEITTGSSTTDPVSDESTTGNPSINDNGDGETSSDNPDSEDTDQPAADEEAAESQLNTGEPEETSNPTPRRVNPHAQRVEDLSQLVEEILSRHGITLPQGNRRRLNFLLQLPFTNPALFANAEVEPIVKQYVQALVDYYLVPGWTHFITDADTVPDENFTWEVYQTQATARVNNVDSDNAYKDWVANNPDTVNQWNKELVGSIEHFLLSYSIFTGYQVPDAINFWHKTLWTWCAEFPLLYQYILHNTTIDKKYLDYFMSTQVPLGGEGTVMSRDSVNSAGHFMIYSLSDTIFDPKVEELLNKNDIAPAYRYPENNPHEVNEAILYDGITSHTDSLLTVVNTLYDALRFVDIDDYNKLSLTEFMEYCATEHLVDNFRRRVRESLFFSRIASYEDVFAPRVNTTTLPPTNTEAAEQNIQEQTEELEEAIQNAEQEEVASLETAEEEEVSANPVEVEDEGVNQYDDEDEEETSDLEVESEGEINNEDLAFNSPAAREAVTGNRAPAPAPIPGRKAPKVAYKIRQELIPFLQDITKDSDKLTAYRSLINNTISIIVAQYKSYASRAIDDASQLDQCLNLLKLLTAKNIETIDKAIEKEKALGLKTFAKLINDNKDALNLFLNDSDSQTRQALSEVFEQAKGIYIAMLVLRAPEVEKNFAGKNILEVSNEDLLNYGEGRFVKQGDKIYIRFDTTLKEWDGIKNNYFRNKLPSEQSLVPCIVRSSVQVSRQSVAPANTNTRGTTSNKSTVPIGNRKNDVEVWKDNQPNSLPLSQDDINTRISALNDNELNSRIEAVNQIIFNNADDINFFEKNARVDAVRNTKANITQYTVNTSLPASGAYKTYTDGNITGAITFKHPEAVEDSNNSFIITSVAPVALDENARFDLFEFTALRDLLNGKDGKKPTGWWNNNGKLQFPNKPEVNSFSKNLINFYGSLIVNGYIPARIIDASNFTIENKNEGGRTVSQTQARRVVWVKTDQETADKFWSSGGDTEALARAMKNLYRHLHPNAAEETTQIREFQATPETNPQPAPQPPVIINPINSAEVIAQTQNTPNPPAVQPTVPEGTSVSNQSIVDTINNEPPEPAEDTPTASGGDGASTDTPARSVTGEAPLLRDKPYTSTKISADNSLYKLLYHLGSKLEEREQLLAQLENALYKEKKSLEDAISEYLDTTDVDEFSKPTFKRVLAKILAPLKDNYRLDSNGNLIFSEEARASSLLTIKNNLMYLNEFFTLTSELRDSTYLSSYSAFCSTLENIAKESGATNLENEGIDPQLKQILTHIAQAVKNNLKDNFNSKMDEIAFNAMEFFTQNYLFMTPRTGVIAWNSPIVASLCHSTDDTARQEELEYIKEHNEIQTIRTLAASFATFNSFSHRTGELVYDCLGIARYSELHQYITSLTDTQLDAVKEMLGMVCTKAFVDSGFIINEVIDLNTKNDPDSQKNILRGRASNEITYEKKKGESYFTPKEKSLDPFRDLHNGILTLSISDITGHAYQDNNVKLHPDDVNINNETPVRNPKNKEMLEKNAKLPFVIDKYYTDFIEGFLTEKIGDITLQEYIIKGLNGEISFDFNTHTSPFFDENTTIGKFAKVVGLQSTNGKDAVTANAININNQNKLKTMVNMVSLKYRFQLEDKAPQYNNGNTYYWTTYSVGANSRFMYRGTDINPQSDKEFTRQITYREGDAVEVGFNQSFIVGDYQISEHDIFAFGIMQNLGLKPEKKGTLQTWYKNGKMMTAVRILVDAAKKSKAAKDYDTKLDTWLKCIEDLESKGYEFEHKFAIINIMQTMEQFANAEIPENCTVDEFWKALDDSLENGKYINYMHIESDGVTNGPAMGVLFTLGILSYIKNQGLNVPEVDGYNFLDSIGIARLNGGLENVTMYDTKTAQDEQGKYIFNNRDLYETIKANIDLDILCTMDSISDFNLDTKINGTECPIKRFLEVCFDADVTKMENGFNALKDSLSEQLKTLKSSTASLDQIDNARQVVKTAYADFIGDYLSRNWIKGPATQGAYGAMLKSITRGLIDHPIGGIFTAFYNKINTPEYIQDAEKTKAELDKLLGVLANPNITKVMRFNEQTAIENKLVDPTKYNVEGNPEAFTLSRKFKEVQDSIEDSYYSQENTVVPKWEFWGNIKAHVRNYALPYLLTSLMNSLEGNLSETARPKALEAFANKLVASFHMEAQFNKYNKDNAPYWFTWVENRYKEFLDNDLGLNDFNQFMQKKLEQLTDVRQLWVNMYKEYRATAPEENLPELNTYEEVINLLNQKPEINSKLDWNNFNAAKPRKLLYESLSKLDNQEAENFYPYILNAISCVALGKYSTSFSNIRPGFAPKGKTYSISDDTSLFNSLDYIFGKGFAQDLLHPDNSYSTELLNTVIGQDYNPQVSQYTPQAISHIAGCKFFEGDSIKITEGTKAFIKINFSNTPWKKVIKGEKDVTAFEAKQIEIANFIMSYFQFNSDKRDNGIETLINTAEAYNRINPFFYRRNFKDAMLHRRGVPPEASPVIVSEEPYDTAEARERESRRLYIFDCSQEVLSLFQPRQNQDGTYYKPADMLTGKTGNDYITKGGNIQYVQCSQAYYMADTVYSPGKDSNGNPVIKNVDLVTVPNALGDNGLVVKEAKAAGIPVLNYSAHVIKFHNKYYLSSTKEGRKLMLNIVKAKRAARDNKIQEENKDFLTAEVFPLSLLKDIFKYKEDTNPVGARIGHRLKLMYIKNPIKFAEVYAKFLGSQRTATNKNGSFDLVLGKSGFPRVKDNSFSMLNCAQAYVDAVEIKDIFTKSSKYTERNAENFEKGYDHSRGFTSENIYDLTHAIIPLFENTIGQAIFKSMMKPMGNNRAMTQMCIAPLEILSFMADSFKNILNGKTPLNYSIRKIQNEAGKEVDYLANFSNINYQEILKRNNDLINNKPTSETETSVLVDIKEALVESFNILFNKSQLNLPSGEGISILKKEYESDLNNPLRMTDTNGVVVTGSGRIASTNSAGISLTVDGIQSNDSNIASDTALEGLQQTGTMPLNIHDAAEMLCNHMAFIFNRLQNKAFLNSIANPGAKSRYLQYASFFKNYATLFAKYSQILNVDLSKELTVNLDNKYNRANVIAVAAQMGLITSKTLRDLGVELTTDEDGNRVYQEIDSKDKDESTINQWYYNTEKLVRRLGWTKIAIRQAFNDGFYNACIESVRGMLLMPDQHKKSYSYHMGLYNKAITSALYATIGYYVEEHPGADYHDVLNLESDLGTLYLPDGTIEDQTGAVLTDMQSKFIEFFKQAYNPYASIDEEAYNGILTNDKTKDYYETGKRELANYKQNVRTDSKEAYRAGATLFNMDQRNNIFNTIFQNPEVHNTLFNHMLKLIQGAEEEHLKAMQDFHSGDYSIFQYNMGIAFKGNELMDTYNQPRYRVKNRQNIAELYGKANETPYNETKSALASLIELNDYMLEDVYPIDKAPKIRYHKRVDKDDPPKAFNELSETEKNRVLDEIAEALPYYVKNADLDFDETLASTNPYDFIAEIQRLSIGTNGKISELTNTANHAMGILEEKQNPTDKDRPAYGIPFINLIAITDNNDLAAHCKKQKQRDALNVFNQFKQGVKEAYKAKFNEWKNVLPQDLRTAGKDERHNNAGAREDADLRSAMIAAINNQPISDPAVQTIVTNTKNQVLRNFDALESTVTVNTASGVGTIRAISPQFSNTLRGRMEKIADMLAGVKVLVVNHGRAGLAATSNKVVAITRSVGDAIQHGIPMSVREMYAHENMHIVFKAVDRYSPEFKTLRRSWVQAREYFADNMHLLRQHNWTAAELGSQDLADQANAREDANARVMYDYMFGTGAEGTASNDVIEEFAVLAYTNEFINNALSQVPYVKGHLTNVNDKDTARSVLGALIDFISTAISTLLQKASNKFKRNTVNVTPSLMDTVEAVFDAANKTEKDYFQIPYRQTIDRLSTVLDRTLDTTDTGVSMHLDEIGREPVAQRVQAFGHRLERVLKKVNRFTRETLNEVTNSYYSKDGRKVIASFINKISALNRTRQQNLTEDTRVLLGSFANKLTEPMARAIRNGVCILDLQCLKNVGYNNQQIMSMLTTGVGLDDTLRYYNDAVVNNPILNIPELPSNYTNFVINAANNLACKLATDSWSNEITLHNAAQILLGFGTEYNGVLLKHSSPEEQAQVESQLNAYITLQAMKLYREQEANQEDLQTLQELYRVETNAAAMRAAHKSTGFDSVLNYHQGSVLAARQYLGNTTISSVDEDYEKNYLVRLTNVRKGYLKTQFNPYYESIIVNDEATYEDLKQKGYVVYTGPETAGFVPNKLGFTPKLMHNSVPVVNRHTSGALATIDTHFVGAELISEKEAVENYMAAVPIDNQFDTILPITPNKSLARELGFDSKGVTKAIRFVDSMELREKLLKEDTNFAPALAATAANIEEKQVSFAANRSMIDALIDIHNHRTDKDYDEDEWIELSPDSENPVVQEDYSTLPQDTRKYLHERLGGEHLFIKKDYYNLIFGFHNFSLRRLMDPGTEEYKAYGDRCLHILKKAAYQIFAQKWGLRTQAIWEYLVHNAKDAVVNKSFIVSLNNIRSNIQVLSIAGVSPIKAISQTLKGYEYYTDYNDKMRRFRNILTRLNIEELTADERAALRSEFTSLQNDIQNNPMSEFIRLGGATSIVGGEYDINREEPSPLPDELKFLDNSRMDAGVFRRLTPILDVLFIRHNTKLYDMAQELATGTDTVAKWIYYTHLREKKYPQSRDRRINEQNATNAFLDAQEMFINYDLPTNKVTQAANDLGVVWFSKFILRTQMPILHLFTGKFARAVMYLTIWKVLNPPLTDGAILTSNLLNIDKNLYNIKNPITSVFDSSNQLPAFKFFAWFSNLPW